MQFSFKRQYLARTLFVIQIAAFSFLANGQPGIYTEDDVRFQTRYLESQELKYMGKTEEQKKILQELIEMDRACHSCYYEMSLAYQKEGDLSKAESNIEKAVRYDEKNIDYLNTAFDIYVLNKNEQKMIDAFDLLIKGSSQQSMVRGKLIPDLIHLGSYKKALSEISKVENSMGITEKSTQWKMKIYQDQGDTKNEIKAVEELVETYPDDVRFLNNLASMYFEDGKKDKAVSIYKKVLTMDPDNPRANLVMLTEGIASNEDSHYLKAVMPLIENTSIPLDDKIKELIPYVQQMNGDPSSEENIQLLKASNKLIKMYPKDGKVYALQGDLNYYLGEHKKAEENYKETIQLNPNIYNVWDIRMRNAIQLDDNKLLKSLAQKAVDLFPLEFNPYFFYSLSELKDNELDNAETQMKEASFIAANDPLYNSRIDLLKAQRHIIDNQVDEALNLLTKYEEYKVEEFLLYETLGDIYSSKKDKDNAAKYWELSKNLGNSSSSILKKAGA